MTGVTSEFYGKLHVLSLSESAEIGDPHLVNKSFGVSLQRAHHRRGWRPCCVGCGFLLRFDQFFVTHLTTVVVIHLIGVVLLCGLLQFPRLREKRSVSDQWNHTRLNRIHVAVWRIPLNQILLLYQINLTRAIPMLMMWHLNQELMILIKRKPHVRTI